MKINLQMKDGICILSLDGILSAETEAVLWQTVEPVLAGSHKMILNLSHLEYIDNSGLNCLGMLRERSGASGVMICLACLQILPRTVFAMQKLFPLFRIYDTVEDALLALQADPS